MNYCHLCQAARFGKRSDLEGGGRPKCRIDDWPLASCCLFEYCATKLHLSGLSVSWGWRRNSNSVMGCRHESWHRMTTGAARLGLVALAVLLAANPSNKRLIWRCFFLFFFFFIWLQPLRSNPLEIGLRLSIGER